MATKMSRPSPSTDPKPTLIVQELLTTIRTTTARSLGTTSAAMAIQALEQNSTIARPRASCKSESIPVIMAALGLRNFS